MLINRKKTIESLLILSIYYLGITILNYAVQKLVLINKPAMVGLIVTAICFVIAPAIIIGILTRNTNEH